MTPPSAPASTSSLRLVADQALSRAAGAPLVAGNAVRLLKDARENFPAWREAIAAATRSILFESYIVDDDAVGRGFRDQLAAKAAAGVRVRVLYDWLGSPGKLGSRFWRPLRQAGGEVRVFNPPRFDSPFGWLSRDHRKSIVVDGAVGFVTGLCVSAAWEGDPAKGRDPWRDTGVEIRGPAVLDVERAFAAVWAEAGAPIPDAELTPAADAPTAGGVALRVVSGAPSTAGLLRLDQYIAAVARKRLWLTDAYFVPLPSYSEALRAAARDGVDVRLLLPGASDIPLVTPLSRAGYPSLLEAGVRVYEWNGSMLHAKTAIADGRWARVGSTNLNPASFIGNYELDVTFEDEGVAAAMERMYLEDLTHATEIVLRPRWRAMRPRPASGPKPQLTARSRRSSARGAAAGALRVGRAVSSALTRPRELGEGGGRTVAVAGAVLIAIAAVGIRWPHVLGWPLAALSLWIGLSLVIRAWRSRRRAAPR